jgi:hypothetical protein
MLQSEDAKAENTLKIVGDDERKECGPKVSINEALIPLGKSANSKTKNGQFIQQEAER